MTTQKNITNILLFLLMVFNLSVISYSAYASYTFEVDYKYSKNIERNIESNVFKKGVLFDEGNVVNGEKVKDTYFVVIKEKDLITLSKSE